MASEVFTTALPLQYMKGSQYYISSLGAISKFMRTVNMFF